LKIPKYLKDNPDKEKIERLKAFYNLFYPMSALEISEFVAKPIGTIRNYIAGRSTIPEMIFQLITRMGVRIYINHAIVHRQVPAKVAAGNKKAYPKSLKRIIIKRLQDSARSIDPEESNKAIQTLKELDYNEA
jgi:hypothetical protein